MVAGLAVVYTQFHPVRTKARFGGKVVAVVRYSWTILRLSGMQALPRSEGKKQGFRQPKDQLLGSPRDGRVRVWVSAAAETWLCDMSSLMRETWVFYAWKQPLSLVFTFHSRWEAADCNPCYNHCRCLKAGQQKQACKVGNFSPWEMDASVLKARAVHLLKGLSADPAIHSASSNGSFHFPWPACVHRLPQLPRRKMVLDGSTWDILKK